MQITKYEDKLLIIECTDDNTTIFIRKVINVLYDMNLDIDKHVLHYNNIKSNYHKYAGNTGAYNKVMELSNEVYDERLRNVRFSYIRRLRGTEIINDIDIPYSDIILGSNINLRNSGISSHAIAIVSNITDIDKTINKLNMLFKLKNGVAD